MSTRRPRTTRCDAAELGPFGRWAAGGLKAVSQGRVCFDWAAGEERVLTGPQGEERVLRNSLRGANGITLAWFEPEGQCEVDVLCDR